MAKKNWAKIGAMLTFLGVMGAFFFGVNSLSGLDEAQRYFSYTAILLFAMFIYFEYLKEYPSSKKGE